MWKSRPFPDGWTFWKRAYYDEKLPKTCFSVNRCNAALHFYVMTYYLIKSNIIAWTTLNWFFAISIGASCCTMPNRRHSTRVECKQASMEVPLEVPGFPPCSVPDAIVVVVVAVVVFRITTGGTYDVSFSRLLGDSIFGIEQYSSFPSFTFQQLRRRRRWRHGWSQFPSFSDHRNPSRRNLLRNTKLGYFIADSFQYSPPENKFWQK